MKLAFIDNLPVGGGLSRFSYMLCKSLTEADPSLSIHYFVHADNLKRTPELKTLPPAVTLRVLKSSQRPSLLQRVTRKAKRVLKAAPVDRMAQEIERSVAGFDLAYFPSAHMMPYPSLSVPVVGTIHDFNWKYFFGRQIFSTDFVKLMDVEIVKWMTDAFTISSSNDVINEARKLYPSQSRYPSVVPIAPVVLTSTLTDMEASQALEAIGINYPYILFPGNFFPHKNHLNLFSGFHRLRKTGKFNNLKLILSGMGTDQLPFGIAESNGVHLTGSSGSYDVRGLGYQPNHVIDALIKKAKLVVSPSLYEAICTPGMDAWSFGTPTAIADIPPFREHEQVWGIRSAFFDPMSPENIAHVLEEYLLDEEKATRDGAFSKERMGAYPWSLVAKGYLDIFAEAIRKK